MLAGKHRQDRRPARSPASAVRTRLHWCGWRGKWCRVCDCIVWYLCLTLAWCARVVAAVSAVRRGQVQGSNWLGVMQSLCCWPVRCEWSNVQPVLRALQRGAVLNSQHSCGTHRERLHRLLGWTVRRCRRNEQPVFWTVRSRAVLRHFDCGRPYSRRLQCLCGWKVWSGWRNKQAVLR